MPGHKYRLCALVKEDDALENCVSFPLPIHAYVHFCDNLLAHVFNKIFFWPSGDCMCIFFFFSFFPGPPSNSGSQRGLKHLPRSRSRTGPPGGRWEAEAAVASSWAAFGIGVGGAGCRMQMQDVGDCLQRRKAPMTLSTCQVLHFHLPALNFPSNLLMILKKCVLVEISVGKVDQFGV